jgi:glycosyltransferase involved in cell wall biosynthesis
MLFGAETLGGRMTSVTVGFPVYNGEATIERSLRCILDGTFRDIKVIVSDNQSTDNTPDIINSIAASDSRVTVIHQPENLGAVGNFRYLAERADTPYFMWRAHDDVSDPDYIDKLHKALSANDKAVLAASRILTTKTRREEVRRFSPRIESGDSADWKSLPHVQAAWVYGLFRTNFARESMIFSQERYGHLWGGDMIMLLQALLDGGIVGTNETTFNQRCLVLGKPDQQLTKPEKRRIVREFYDCAEELADRYNITGAKRNLYRVHVWRYIFKRVVRWRNLI